jgi:hypothetical protein
MLTASYETYVSFYERVWAEAAVKNPMQKPLFDLILSVLGELRTLLPKMAAEEAYPVVPGSSRFSVWAGWLPRLARGLNRPVGSPLPSYAAVAGVEPWRRRCEGWHGR